MKAAKVAQDAYKKFRLPTSPWYLGRHKRKRLDDTETATLYGESKLESVSAIMPTAKQRLGHLTSFGDDPMRMTPNENAESARESNDTKGGRGSETIAEIEGESGLHCGSPGHKESGGVRFHMQEEHPDKSVIRGALKE